MGSSASPGGAAPANLAERANRGAAHHEPARKTNAQARPAQVDRQRRRQLGDVPGDDDAGAVGGVDLLRPHRPRRQSEERIRPDTRCGPGRHGRGARTAERRLQGAGSRVSAAGRRPVLDDPRRRSLHRARRRRAGVRLRQGSLSEPRPVAHSVAPSRRHRLLQASRRRPRAVRAGELQRLRARQERLRRQAATLPASQGRLRRGHRRTAGQGHEPEEAGRRRIRRRQGPAARCPEKLGCPRRELCL